MRLISFGFYQQKARLLIKGGLFLIVVGWYSCETKDISEICSVFTPIY